MALDWQYPYPSQRAAVMGENVVSTSQPLAAQAGLSMLYQGGNAVDAAIAAAACLTVVEPTGCGIGSDAFALVWDGQRLNGLNASGRAPKAWTPDYFKGLDHVPKTGWDSVTVPGAVSSWIALSERYGKLPLRTVMQPAISYARDGFLVSPTVASLWQMAASKLGQQPGFADCFMPNGRAPQAGERVVNSAQAHTLHLIAETQGEAFYRGELAQKIAAHAKAYGGALSMDDLADHQSNWCEPISTAFGAYRLHEIPPNGQGIAALMAVGMLDTLGFKGLNVDDAQTVHLCIEAMKLAFADLYEYNAELHAMRVSPHDLLSPSYLKQRASLIDPDRAQAPDYGQPKEGGTVYVSTADASGMMVSFIQSNYMGFGSGVVVPDTGISLQNRGHGFSLDPTHANCVAPGKRPSHTILPAFVTQQNGDPYMSFGVMGGPMQSQGHVQMCVRILHFNQNPQAASDAPRWRVTGGLNVSLEQGFDPQVAAALQAKGHQITLEQGSGVFAFGGAQLIVRNQDGYVAGSDHRKDGLACAF